MQFQQEKCYPDAPQRPRCWQFVTRRSLSNCFDPRFTLSRNLFQNGEILVVNLLHLLFKYSDVLMASNNGISGQGFDDSFSPDGIECLLQLDKGNARMSFVTVRM